MEMATTTKHQRNTRIHGLLQLLLEIHRRIQQDGQTFIRPDEKGHILGMGTKRTKRVQQIAKKIMFNTGVDILRTRKKVDDQNGCFKIHLFWETRTTRRGRNMETDSISVKNHGAGRMQLRRARQRTISNCSSPQGIETIRPRKSKASRNTHRPQESSTLHDDEGANRSTNSMDGSTQQIRLHDQIPTRKRRWKTRHPHKKKTGYAETR